MCACVRSRAIRSSRVFVVVKTNNARIFARKWGFRLFANALPGRTDGSMITQTSFAYRRGVAWRYDRYARETETARKTGCCFCDQTGYGLCDPPVMGLRPPKTERLHAARWLVSALGAFEGPQWSAARTPRWETTGAAPEQNVSSSRFPRCCGTCIL